MQPFPDRHPGLRPCARRRREQPRPPAAGAFGVVHREIGVDQQIAGGRRAVRAGVVHRHPDARRHRRGHRTGGRDRVGADALGKRVGDPPRALRRRRRRQQNSELVAAEAGEHVHVAQPAAQQTRHAEQQLVADRMAVDVVDRLEVVQIHDQHPERVSGTPRHAQRALHFLIEAPPVREPGQRIGRRQPQQLIADAVLVGEIAHHHQMPGQAAVRVTQRGHRPAHARPRAVLARPPAFLAAVPVFGGVRRLSGRAGV
jgi:hypothetical protein